MKVVYILNNNIYYYIKCQLYYFSLFCPKSWAQVRRKKEIGRNSNFNIMVHNFRTASFLECRSMCLATTEEPVLGCGDFYDWWSGLSAGRNNRSNT
jgi:hypothetical protein